MPKMTIDDLKRLATHNQVKSQRYREAALIAGNDNQHDGHAFTLRQEARRCEALANALFKVTIVKDKENELLQK